MKIEAFAIKSPSGFKITARKTFEDGLNSLPDGNYTVIVEKRVKKRSVSFNRYYWIALVEPVMHFLIKDWGDVIETACGPVVVNKGFAHEWLLRNFNTDTVVNDAGEEMTVTLRTSSGDGNKSDNFRAYVERCKKGIFLRWNYHCKEEGDQLEIDSQQ